MDKTLGILIVLNMSFPQKLVLVPGDTFRGNTVTVAHAFVTNRTVCEKNFNGDIRL